MTLRGTLRSLWRHKWPLMSLAVSFRLLEGLLFLPLAGFVGKYMVGQPAVDSTDLVAFLLSPRGFLVAVLGAVSLLTIRLVEHAGLSTIALGALEDKTVGVLPALKRVLGEAAGLASLGARITLGGLLLAAPVAAVAGAFAARLLPRHDINYYLANLPPEFLAALGTIGALGLLAAGIAVWLLVRWRLVVQADLFDHRHGGQAFRESARLTRGCWWPLAGWCLGLGLFELALGLASSATGRGMAGLVLGLVSPGTLSLAVWFGVLVVLWSVVSALVTLAGTCVDAGVITAFYRERRLALGGQPILAVAETGRQPAGSLPPGAWWLAAALVLGLVVAAGISSFLAADALKHERPIAVTAHRGGTHRAPENTAAAVREAIDVGAQYAEIDVQMSRDGVLVVAHDSDFSRLGGVARKVWELNYQQIRAIPLGARAAPEFRREPAPTLDELLALADGRIKLNIELKYYGDHQPGLARRVVEAVRARGMTNQVIIQCLEYAPLQEVRRLAPAIPVGYLLSVNARHPARLDVDFLGTELSRVNGAYVRAAHRRGQQVHVWTVDKPADIQRMIDLGVDALITNQPALALRLVREYEALSRPERALRRIRAWLGADRAAAEAAAELAAEPAA